MGDADCALLMLLLAPSAAGNGAQDREPSGILTRFAPRATGVLEMVTSTSLDSPGEA
jgi:hypothetical protein